MRGSPRKEGKRLFPIAILTDPSSILISRRFGKSISSDETERSRLLRGNPGSGLRQQGQLHALEIPTLRTIKNPAWRERKHLEYERTDSRQKKGVKESYTSITSQVSLTTKGEEQIRQEGIRNIPGPH